MPRRAHKDDAGYDLFANEDMSIMGGCVERIKTGIHLEIPKGHYGRVANRSSMYAQGLSVSGTIDCGFSGEIMVIMMNHTASEYRVHKGDKIAQLIIGQFECYDMELVDELPKTERGDNGFGSTGR